MYYGAYKKGQKVWIFANTHKFETGQRYDAAVTGYFLRVGSDPASKVSLTFNKFDGETGIYYAEVDTSNLEPAIYLAITKATIDTIQATQSGYFEVLTNYGYYGRSRYGQANYG